MTSKELIAYLKGSWVHFAIIIFGLVSGIILYGKFQSGDLSFGNLTSQEELEDKQDKVTFLKKRLLVGVQRLGEVDAKRQTLEQFTAVQSELREQEAANAANAGKLVSLDQALAETDEMFDAYRQRYRSLVRGKAAGTQLEKLTTLDGKTYHKVEIKAVGALGMNITHQEGSRRIPFRELPVEMQRLYQFDDAEAEALKQREADRRRRLELAHQAALNASQQENPDQGGSGKVRRQIAEMERAMDRLKTANRSLEARIKHASKRLREENAKKVNRALQYKQELSELRAAEDINKDKMRELRERIRRLEDQLRGG